MRNSFSRLIVAAAALWVFTVATEALPQTPTKDLTVQDVMATMIDPASKVVFEAVSVEETPNGTVEKAPQNDAEWAEVRRSALTMVEGADLLLTPRPFAVPANAQKHNDGELAPADIEKLVAKDRATWNKLAQDFRATADRAAKAAEAKRKQDFNEVNEALDTACENCHLRYWYPDQVIP